MWRFGWNQRDSARGNVPRSVAFDLDNQLAIHHEDDFLRAGVHVQGALTVGAISGVFRYRVPGWR